MSLDAQRSKLKAYAELYELDLVDVIVDAGYSAKSLDRPGLRRALGMLKAGDVGTTRAAESDGAGFRAGAGEEDGRLNFDSHGIGDLVHSVHAS